MYKLLIADDEDQLRNLILTQIDWNAIGFEVIGARDGKEALELVDAGFVPDALLTDVRMPFVDGLELCERLKERYHDILTIVLSGHDEFSYAKKSMQLGTTDYLLKPIRPSALKEAMQSLKEKLDLAASRKQDLANIRMQLDESMPILRQQYLLMLLYDSFPQEMILDQFSYLGIELAGNSYTLCLLSHPVIANPADKFFTCFAVQNLLQKLFPSDCACFFDNAGMQMVLCGSGGEPAERDQIKDALQEAIARVGAQFSLQATAAMGIDVTSLSDLPEAYKSALAALEEQIIGGSGVVYDALESTSFLEDTRLELPFALAEKVASIFAYEQVEVLEHNLQALFDEVRSHHYKEITYLRLLCADLINNIHRSANRGKISIDGEIYDRLFVATNWGELQNIVRQHVLALKTDSDQARAQKQSGVIQQAFDYIEQNFADPSLSLSKTAQVLFVSPSYLSNLFKRKCNMNFVDYVTHLRVERAKKLLLETEMKAYEIATKVGYKDPQYFSNSFKRQTGMSPSEFRSHGIES